MKWDIHLSAKSKHDLWKSAAVTLLALLVMGLILFPVYYMFIVSLKPVGTLASSSIELVPHHATLENYREVLIGHDEVTVKSKVFNLSASKGILFGNGFTVEFTNGNVWGKSLMMTQFNVKYVSDLNVRGANKTNKNGQVVYVEGKSASMKAKEINSNMGVIGAYLSAEKVVITVEGSGTAGLPLQNFQKIGNNTYVGTNVDSLRLPGRVRMDIGKGTFTTQNFFLLIVNHVGGGFFGYLKRSLIIATLTVILTLLFVVPAAYAFSRLRFFGREHVLYFYLMFTQVAGGLGIAGLVALYGMLVKLHLTNNLYVLPFIYAAGGVPFNTWLLKSYLDSISTDFDEAALVDGAGYLQIIWHVLLPMALPGIATVSIFAFIGGWTELIVANLLLNSSKYPLTVWLYSMLNDLRNVSWNQFSAAALLFALPVFVLFLLAQNYIRSGLTVGGLKE